MPIAVSTIGNPQNSPLSLEEKIAAQAKENAAQLELLKKEYGDWVTMSDVLQIKQAVREMRQCEGCTGLPCKKPAGKHFNVFLEIDAENQQVRAVSNGACKFWKEKNRKSKFQRCRIPARYIGKTFKDYEETEGNKVAVSWAKYTVAHSEQGLLFYGAPGCGKTMLASIIAQELIKSGKNVLFGDVPTLLDEMKSTFNKESTTLENLMKELETVDILILDDIGTEYATDWAVERLYMIVNNRYNSGKTLIVTSNFDAQGLIKRFKDTITGRRIVSRLTQICKPIRISDSDRRLR